MADPMVHLTARLVTAFLSRNTLAPADVPGLIRSTYATVAGTDAPVPPPAERQLPVVSLRRSVTPEAIICLECGKSQKMLKRHLATAHGLSVSEYRAKWSLSADYPMVAPDYAQHRSNLAVKIGLGRKRPAETAPAQAPAEPERVEGKPQHRYPASRWSKPAE